MFEKKGLFSSVYWLMEWITRFAYTNLLWILFTLCGLVLFGLAPATTALFIEMKKWSEGNTDGPVFKSFMVNFRKNFFSANKLALPLLLLCYVLYIDYQYLYLLEGIPYIILLMSFIIVIILFALCLFYLLPIHILFEQKWLSNYKQAILIGISHPAATLTLVCSTVLALLIVERVPGLLPFFPVSILSFVYMKTTILVVNRLKENPRGAAVTK